MQWLKQSTSITVKVGPFLDSTDGNTVEGALTITQPDVRLTKNGGNFAQKAAAQTLTHDEGGWYGLTLDATDTDTLGTLTVFIHETGALQVWEHFMVVPANVWDSLFGADVLKADVSQWLNTAVATPAVAGVPSVDVIKIENADPTDQIRDAANAACVDVLTVDTSAELSAVPAAASSIADRINLLFMHLRNAGVATASSRTVAKDDGTAVGTATVTDDTVTLVKGKLS